jgi:N-formylglutamate amidohydrolase
MIAGALELHDEFYSQMNGLLSELVARHGCMLVLDLHSYNHRRGGSNTPPADPRDNPDINVGTGTMDRRRWAPVIDRFVHELCSAPVEGRRLDVRENVRFRGGYFPHWIHNAFPRSACALSVEVKKFYMDEWRGTPDFTAIEAVGNALSRAAAGALEELRLRRQPGERVDHRNSPLTRTSAAATSQP